MQVERLRRFPVKAMGGEELDRVRVDARGLAGDRWFAVRDRDGRFAACKDTRRFRRRDGITGFAARTDARGTVWVGGGAGEWAAGDPVLDAVLSRAMQAPVRVAAEATVPHQDAGQVSLVGSATIAWCSRAWGVDLDPRRLRANLVIGTDQPFVEETWVGAHLAVGPDVVLRAVERIPRCRTVDVAQDGVVPRHRALGRLVDERGGLLGVYADVVIPGTIAVGDRVVAGVAPR